MNITKTNGIVLLAALIACASCNSSGQRERDELGEISAHHDFDLQQFQEVQAEFARRNPTPRRIDFPGQGTVLVHESSLEGYPGREELWLRYSYVNTLDHTIDAARITITLSDPETRSEWTETTHLALPISFRLTPDSSYTTYAHIPTRGIHLHPSWSWSIRAEAIVHD
jgi:hypothetical protein